MELPLAAEYLDLSTIHSTVVNRLNELTMFSRSSNENVLLGTTDEFVPDALDYDVTDLIGKGVPAFIEQKGNGQDDGSLLSWANIRVVPLSQNNEYRQMGALACSFYGSEGASDTAQATQYVKFTYLPGNACRIRFDRDGERTSLQAVPLLPDNLSELVVLKAQQTLIPRIKSALAMGLRRDKEFAPFARDVMQTLSEVYAQNAVDIAPLYALWKIWAFKDRSQEDSFNLPTPRSGGLYLGGRGWWGNGGSY